MLLPKKIPFKIFVEAVFIEVTDGEVSVGIKNDTVFVDLLNLLEVYDI